MYAGLSCHLEALTDYRHVLAFGKIFIGKAEINLGACGDFIENVVALAHESGIGIHLVETYLIKPNALIDVNKNGETVVFDP